MAALIGGPGLEIKENVVCRDYPGCLDGTDAEA
jgi:hypothetical protein